MNLHLALRTPAHWKSAPYTLICSICELDDNIIEFTDKAHEWAHHWFHITDNAIQRRKYLA